MYETVKVEYIGMARTRCAGFATALALTFTAGCLTLNDISNRAPYSSRIGSTYALISDCELWRPKVAGGEYTILPPLPVPTRKEKAVKLAAGTQVQVEAARRGQHDDYLIVTLDSPDHPGYRILAAIQPRYLEGWMPK
jgi:hypothetical protein